MAAFALDPRLEADSVFVADLDLCQVRLMDDARFAWLLLVPRRGGLVDLTDLDEAERAQAMAEVAAAAGALKACGPCDKLNVAALGNVVPQLHLHVIARTKDDAAWPAPVWSAGAREPYAADARDTLAARLGALLLEPAGGGR